MRGQGLWGESRERGLRGEPATLVLVAHGTRSPRGVSMIAALAEDVSEFVPRVRTAFVDVLGPSPSEVLRDLSGPAVVVPAFLASGYHVHTDVPREVSAGGHAEVVVTRALGPDPALAVVLYRRLQAVGWRRGDRVVLAAAGSSDARARRDVARAAGLLSYRLGERVELGYTATGEPRVADVVARLRRGRRRVVVASYLLAHGLFQERLVESGADAVSAPLGAHPALVGLIAERYRSGVRELARASADSALVDRVSRDLRR